jgi:hypothetical protein
MVYTEHNRSIAVFATTLVLMAGFGFAAASGEHELPSNMSVRFGRARSPPQPSHSDIQADIQAAQDAESEFSSCKKAVVMTEELARKYQLSQKLDGHPAVLGHEYWRVFKK